MDKEELKKVFHLLFNKINNICIATASNKELLKQEDIVKISHEELRRRASFVFEVFSKVEGNARFLEKELEGLYESLVEKKDF